MGLPEEVRLVSACQSGRARSFNRCLEQQPSPLGPTPGQECHLLYSLEIVQFSFIDTMGIVRVELSSKGPQ